MTSILEEGWAVRISLPRGYRPWLNHGGGYSPSRRDRKVWGDYDDALDASHEWDHLDPVIVRVVFKGASPLASEGEVKP